MNEIIHVHIYEPHRGSIFGKTPKNERSQLHIYTCEQKDKCDAYKRGQCINVGNVFGSRCPIGKVSKSSGLTQRAQKYCSQINEWQERYKEFYSALDSAPKRITKVAEGWMLPYSFMDMNESIPFKAHGGAFVKGCAFLSDEDFNEDIFNRILNYKPIAMMGGEIKDYQKNVVPKFLHDFKVNYPKEFERLSEDSEIAKAAMENLNFVGRMAYLKTIKPDVEVTISSDIWQWDGEKITRTDVKFMIFEPCKWESCYAEFKPSDKAIVKITSNDQVCDKTVFAD